MFLIAQISTQLPPLPEGPASEHLRGPVVIPAYELWQIALFTLLGCLLLCGGLWCLLKWIRRDRSKKESAHASALKSLESAAMHAQQDADRLAVLCSAAIRNYFSEGFHVAADMLTSEEFLRSLKGNTSFNGEFHKALTHFLQQCDAVKFARQSIDSDQGAALISGATELINAAEKAREVVQP